MTILRNRSLLIMAGAEVVSSLGNWIAVQAVIALLIFQQGGGVGQSTVLLVCGLGPSMVLGPFAGWLVDRVDRRKLMIASELLSGLVVAALIFTDRAELVYLLIALATAAGTVMVPARSSVLPDIVDPRDLTRANAFAQQVNGLTRVLAPLIGAGIVALVSTQTALLLDVISFALSAVILRLLPALPPRRERVSPTESAETSAAKKPSIFQVLWNVVNQVPLLKVLLPFNLMLGLVMIAFDITLAVFARDILQSSIAMKGLIASLIGAGMGAASLTLMLLKGERRLERDYLLGLTLVICLPGAFSLGAIVSSTTTARVIVILGSLLGGLGIGWSNVQGNTLVQRVAPDGWLGRINGGLQSVFTGGQLAGLVATPLLVPGVVSFGVYFGIGALLLLLLMGRTALALIRGNLTNPVPAKEVVGSD